ncbi:sigma 54-interacting transcriptional regulator [Vibrio parahaemolyticus]|uniref:sigma 54-interacting transcriptional regulator n=1 Tax=Vibrio parahaemolyticus TaxID=670 RepID=UPI0032619B54|nr:sigma 54-interacting transcriptional regulator [Vibrio parahaemolyticus]HCE2180487.1 sigma 54-interacting transcriptional regulator [Vibrio parahaemolyticus]HCG6551762.1 sigma 54-interacting transcriptional regulator [Vibrio parahaemolyticus]HCG7649137.1 sigma 54-interacting transcriptional regulator [Vibrio parahaemolyticus]
MVSGNAIHYCQNRATFSCSNKKTNNPYKSDIYESLLYSTCKINLFRLKIHLKICLLIKEKFIMDCRYFHVGPNINCPDNHRLTSYLLSLKDGNDWILKSPKNECEGDCKREHDVSQKSLDGVIQAAQELEWGSYLIGKLSVAPESDKIKNNLTLFATVEIDAEMSKTIDNLLKPGTTCRDLIKYAKSIQHRKTVLMLPEYSKASDFPAFLMEKLAEQVHQMLIHGNENLGLVCRKTPPNQEKEQPYKKLIDHLLLRMWSTESDVKNGIYFERCMRPGPVLFEGETGTGKSVGAALLAQKLSKKLVTVNLASMTNDLIESKLRGANKGSFTGAVDQKGAFEEANQQVLLLDELQNASSEAQTQMLDLLNATSNDVTVSRLGTHSPQTYNVKVILALNEPLDKLIKEDRIRHDLLHRVRSIVRLPTFKDRIKALTENEQDQKTTFLKTLLKIYRYQWQECWQDTGSIPDPFFAIDDDALMLIQTGQWPGNFRQFARFAFDLFDTNKDLDRETVERAMEEENHRSEIHLPSAIEDGALVDIQQSDHKHSYDHESYKLAVVEQVLKRHDYIIAHCLNDMAFKETYKLGSRPALRSYLIANEDKLSPELLKQSNIKKFMKKDNG